MDTSQSAPDGKSMVAVASGTPGSMAVKVLRLRHEQYISRMQLRWGAVQLLLGLSVFYDAAVGDASMCRALIDTLVSAFGLASGGTPVLGFVKSKEYPTLVQLLLSSASMLQAMAGTLLCLNGCVLLCAALAHTLAAHSVALNGIQRRLLAVTRADWFVHWPAAPTVTEVPSTPKPERTATVPARVSSRALDWLFFLKRRTPPRPTRYSPPHQQMGQPALSHSVSQPVMFGRVPPTANATMPVHAGFDSTGRPANEHVGALAAQMRTPPSTFRPAFTSSPYVKQEYSTPSQQHQQQQPYCGNGSAYSPGQATASLQLSTSMLRDHSFAPSPSPPQSAQVREMPIGFAQPQPIPVLVSTRADLSAQPHQYLEQSLSDSVFGSQKFDDSRVRQHRRFEPVTQQNIDFNTALERIKREEIAEHLSPRHHLCTDAQLDDYLRRYDRTDDRLQSGADSARSVLDVWNLSSQLLASTSRFGGVGGVSGYDDRSQFARGAAPPTGYDYDVQKGDAATARVYSMVSEALKKPTAIDSTTGPDASADEMVDMEKEFLRDSTFGVAAVRARRRSSGEASAGSGGHHLSRRPSAISALGKKPVDHQFLSSQVPVTADVYAKFGIDVEHLDEVTLNLRRWVSVTVLKQFVSHVDSVNAALKAAGRPDLVIGETSLPTLQPKPHFSTPSNPNTLQQVASHRGGATAVTMCQLLPYLSAAGGSASQSYVVRRARDLASDTCVNQFKHDAGGSELLAPGSTLIRPWSEHLPTDAELVWHFVCSYMDAVLPADARAVALEGRVGTFSCKYALDAPHRPNEMHRWPHACFLYKAHSKPHTHFLLATNGGREVFDPLQSVHNLWHALVLFIAHMRRENDGMIDGMPLDVRGLNLLWIFDC